MRGAAPASAALSVLLCALCIASSRAGQPFGSFLLPDHGDEAGGYDVIVVGRNLGFFPSDMKVFVNGHSAKNIRVDVPWERARFTMPPCPKCGKALVTFKVGDERSQPLEYLFTNACVGPVVPPDVAVLPPPYSGKENCTVCIEVVALAQAVAPDQATYQGLKESLHGTCDTVHFIKYTAPSTHCIADYSAACKVLVQTMADAIIDAMWALWDDTYFYGMLPDAVCQQIKRCDPNVSY